MKMLLHLTMANLTYIEERVLREYTGTLLSPSFVCLEYREKRFQSSTYSKPASTIQKTLFQNFLTQVKYAAH